MIHEDLRDFCQKHPHQTFLQYVDDLLIVAGSEEECPVSTRKLLETLGRPRYWALAKNAQICLKRVTYFGYILDQGQRWSSDARRETVIKIPTPTSLRAVREFLEMAGFCHLWTPGFAELAKPLYALTKESQSFSRLKLRKGF